MEENEQLIVDRMCRGDQKAFQELVERYKRKIYHLAYDILGDHHEAEDISQEVFIRVFRSIKSFRRDAKMSSWIYKITVNTSIDSLRKKKRKPEETMEDLMQANSQDSLMGRSGFLENPELSTEASFIQQHIHKALQKVSPKERTVFVMRYYNDFQINEIADVLNISSGTVKSLLFRALKKLKRELSLYHEKTRLEASYE